VIVFLPTIALGMFALRPRALVAGTVAVLLGFLGVATLAFIDCTNTMVQYDRWLSRNIAAANAMTSRPTSACSGLRAVTC